MADPAGSVAGNPPGYDDPRPAALQKPLDVLRVPPEPNPDPEALPYPPVFRLLGDGGVYEVRTNGLGQFVARIEADATICEGFYPSVPPAPAGLLARTVRIFQDRPHTEALVSVVYDSQAGTYDLVWQSDDAGPGHVSYTPLPEDDRYLVLAEIHSHHTMEAFFSRTDDRAEATPKCYGVIGNVDRERPTALFRFPCGKTPDGETRFRPMHAEDVFAPASEVRAAIEQPLLWGLTA